MSSFVIFTIFAQALLIQSVFSQQCGFPQLYGQQNMNQLGLNNAAPGAGAGAALPALGGCAAYGGTGTGQVAVSGDIDASGNTVVVGSVPVLGSVDFSGTVPASGSVSISGQCGCGCAK